MRISDWSSDVCSSDLADGHGFHPAPIARACDRSSITIIETSCNANIMLVGTNAIGGIERHPAQPRHMRFGPGVRRLLKLRPVLPKQMARYIARRHALAACGGDEDMEIGRESCRERECQYV